MNFGRARCIGESPRSGHLITLRDSRRDLGVLVAAQADPHLHLFEVPGGERKEVEDLVRAEMEGVVKLNVPLVADLGFGPNWRDL